MKVNLHDLGPGNGFLVMTPKVQPNREKHKFDFAKSFVHQKTRSKK